ncbi:MAG: hypothetical protein JWP81_3191 [Ferruginibacter sp.]|nr:hypothetical protein [Ferruginibacter sp.]
MKNLLLLFFSFLCYFHSKAQDTIDVVEKTIKIGGISTVSEYYGFADGDKVIFNLVVDFGKELKDVIISEFPQNVKFADHTVEKVENKILNISRKAIFKFDYYNSNLGSRTIKIKIQRISRSEKTKFFNTNVKWVNKVDTTFQAKQNIYVISSDTSFVEVINSKVRVHSQSNGNPNKTIVDFTLPANTIRWTYWIGVGEESQKAFEKDQANFTSQGVKLISSINPLAGLAVGLFSMTQANIGENVFYYFLPTYEDAQKFNLGQPFKQFKSADVVTDFGLMNYANNVNQRYYVGLVNDNLMQGIDVNVKILAVKVESKYKTVVENIPFYRNTIIPINEE